MAMKYQATNQAPGWTSWTRTQKTQTYDAVKAAGDNGITREEICSRTGLPKQRVWFYLSELRRGGLIKRMGEKVDPATLGPEEAKLYAMVAFENALGAWATEHSNICRTCRGTNDESKKCQTFKDLSKTLTRYNKIKELAMGAKTAGEESAALRMAMLDLVRMVF